MSRAHPADANGLTRDIAVGAAIIALLVAGVVFGGAAGWVFIAAACALAAVSPFGGLVAAAVTVWTLPLVPSPAVVADIRPDELVLVATALGAAPRMCSQRSQPRTGIEPAFIAFLALAIVSVGIKYALGYDASPRAVALPLVRHAFHLLIFVLVVRLASRTREHMRALVIALLAGALLAGALGVAQYHSAEVHSWIAATYPTLDGAHDYPYSVGQYQFRATSAFDGNPNHYGVALALMIVLAAALAGGARRRARTGWLVSALALFVAMLFTESRTAYLVAVAVLAAGTVLRQWTFGAVLGGGLLATVVIPNDIPRRLREVFFYAPEGAEAALPEAVATVTPSAAQATVTPDVAATITPDPAVTARIDMISEGIVTNPNALPLHDNFYLDLFHNFGPIALAGFGLLALVVSVRLVQGISARGTGSGYASGALAAWVTLLAVSLTGGFFATPRVGEILWMLVALGLASLTQRAGSTEREGHECVG